MARRFRFFGLGPEGALALVLTLGVAQAYLGARDLPAVEAIEGRTLDWRFRIRGPQDPGQRVAVVALDDRTLEALGRWPVSRVWLARALDALTADDAQVIAFDLLFVGAEQEPAADAELVRAVREASADGERVVVPFAFTFAKTFGEPAPLLPALARGAFVVTHAPAGIGATTGPSPSGLLMPSAALLEAGVPAHVSLILDADGMLRRLHPVIGYGGAYFPALHVAAARLALGLAPSQLVVLFGEGLSLGGRRIASDTGMRVPLNHLGPAGQVPTRSLIDLVQGRVPKGTFAGRAVLIGATAQGLGDRFATPFGQNIPGVEIFAGALDTILEGRGLERSARTAGLDILAILVCGAAAAALAWQGAALVTVLGGVALIALWGAVCLAAFVFAQLWLSFVFPAAAIALAAAAVGAAQVWRDRSGRHRAERARSALARYVSPLAGGGAEAPGLGEESEIQAVVLFADLRGFTAASEDLSPAEAKTMVRGFHRRVEQAAARHRGIVDKYIGDGALLVFGAGNSDTIPVPTLAAQALACARELAEAASPLEVALGLHLGPVLLGEVGGEDFAQMTVTGDTVNVASRLEALTRSHGVAILASDATIEAARAAGDEAARAALEGFVALPPQAIRGRSQALKAWAWPAPKPSLD